MTGSHHREGAGREVSGWGCKDLHLEERSSLSRGPDSPLPVPELQGDLPGTLPFPGPQFSRRYTKRGGAFLPDQMLWFLP